MVITSGGIYGYLSGAYQETATQSEFLDKQVAIIDQKRTRFIETRDDLKLTVKELTTALANPTQIQYVDKESGQLVTTTSSRQRKLLESRLNTSKIDLDIVTDSISVLDIRVLDAQIGNESARELGPLKYMATLTGQPMEKIVNWFMLLIIFVFDPLAIAMVVAANMAFAQIKGVARDPKDYEVFESPLYTDDDEKRMDVIGQNGNDGIHYEDYVVADKEAEPIIQVKEVIKEVIVEKEVPVLLRKKKPPTRPNNPWGNPGGAR
jgi:hypothetical protein